MSFYELLGPTAVATIICLIVALVMFVIELFTPGVGVAGGTGLLALVAVVVMQAGEDPAGQEGDATHQHEGVAESRVYVLGATVAEQVQQQGADGDAEADGQLLVDRHQATAAGGLLRT